MSDLQHLIKDFEKFTILIVDDKASFRRTLRNMLRSLGFVKFRDAGNGKEALDRLKMERFDFIICDWKMPIMGGLEFFQVILEDEGFQDIPFLMITAEVEEATVAQALEAGVYGYILKPFLMDTLQEKISEIMTNKLVPPVIDVHVQLAQVFMRAGDYDRAHKELDQASAINAESPRVLYVRGLIYELQEEEERAEEFFVEASRNGPMFIKAHEKLSEIYENQGRHSEMLELLEQIIEISPNNPDRQTRLGKALLGQKRVTEAKRAFSKAIELYEKALTMDPDEEYLYYNLARAHLSAENPDLAKTAL